MSRAKEGMQIQTVIEKAMWFAWQVRSQGEQVQRASRAARLGAVMGAEVVACTLSSAGGDLLGLLQDIHAFDTLVIDEACRHPPKA
jgi:hypothetical protein